MMTSVELMTRRNSEKSKSKERKIFFRIKLGQKQIVIESPYCLLSDEWDRQHSVVGTPSDESRAKFIGYINERLRLDIAIIRGIIDRHATSTITVDDLKREIIADTEARKLIPFVGRISDNLSLREHIRTAETYRASVSSFMHFYREERAFLPENLRSCPMIDDLTSDLIDSYQSYLTDKGLTRNTISFYMRTLRAIYNRAADLDIIDQRRPFRNVFTGICRTTKRALPSDIIRRIKKLDLSGNSELEFARDLFILSFCLRGMSFIDMAFLRKSDLRHGQLTYSRRKTGQTLTIAWTSEMREFTKKYTSKHPCYLLPIIPPGCRRERSAYKNAGYRINSSLHRIGHMLGLVTPLTLYVARHSWASVAKAKGIPLGLISEGMGHDSEKTTRIYLSTLDNSAIDRANRLILRSI